MFLPGDKLAGFLSTFVNTKDKDIERFLREKAVDFQKRSWCNTYLLISKADNEYGLKIEGYFTLSLRVLSFGDGVSKNMRKKLNNGINTDSIPVILIGQLGKHIDAENGVVGDTCAEDLIFHAVQVIQEVNDLVPCKCVLLECEKGRNGLRELYTSLGFSQIESDSDYIQLIKRI